MQSRQNQAVQLEAVQKESVQCIQCKTKQCKEGRCAVTLQVLNRLTLACLREVSKDCYAKGDEENMTFGVIMFGGLLKAEDSKRILIPNSICAQTCYIEKMTL